MRSEVDALSADNAKASIEDLGWCFIGGSYYSSTLQQEGDTMDLYEFDETDRYACRSQLTN